MKGRWWRTARLGGLMLWLLLLVLALVAGCGTNDGAPSSGSQGDQAAPQAASAPAPPSNPAEPSPPQPQVQIRTISATVLSVTDGDTFHARLDGRDERVRLIGVNCPEIAHPDLGIKEEPYGREGKAYTERTLMGRTVWLEFDVQERDKYGRLLAYAWLEQPTSGSEEEVRAKMFNARLLVDGYAQVMTVPPNVKYADLFVKLQREAREAGKGLWGGLLAPAGQEGGTASYVGNARSKKFHRADCRYAAEMSPANRVEFGSREEAVRQGYVPCKVCKP